MEFGPRGKKQPKHFKVHCSIQNHRRMIGVYDDDALFAMFTRIGIMAVERYADKTGDSFVCSGRDLERLAACSGVANARRKLGRLEAAGGPTVGQEGAGYRLTFRNFAKKQGFSSRSNHSASSPSSSSSTTTATTTKEERECRKPASPAAPAPTSASSSTGSESRKKTRTRRSPLPDPIPEQFRETIRQRAREFSVDPHALEISLIDWAIGGGYEYVDWNRQLGTMLRSRWGWTDSLFSPSGVQRSDRESAAQARERRTKEAMVEAMRRMSDRDPDMPPLIALAGGRE